MKTLTKSLIAATLLTGLVSGNAMAAGNNAEVITGVSSANLSTAVEAQLFPTDQPVAVSEGRVNYSIDNSKISAELDAELFPITNS